MKLFRYFSNSKMKRENMDERKKTQEKSLLLKLKQYGESDFYPFHMPGHKRREIPDGFPDGFPNPYEIDITEIDGFDNLHHAEGILKSSMEQAAEIYGADQTLYLVNGSTCGILSAIFGCTSDGGRILMARNCHKSVYHALELRHLQAEYLYPEYLPEYGINGGIRPEAVKKALGESLLPGKEKIQAVFLTSPTYEGVVSDIESIAKIVHEAGIPLIVDEAHGAHFPFGNSCFPKSALELGADVVIQSLHKTLPSFTQTAVLHIKGTMVSREQIAKYLAMFQSSSPSYLFMAGMERCILYMAQGGRKEMGRYGERMERFYRSLEPLKVLKPVRKHICGQAAVYDWDCSKIVISTREAPGLDGPGLGDILRQQYHLEMEMCAPEYLVAMTSLMDTEKGLKRLSRALLEIDAGLAEKQFRLEHQMAETKEDARDLIENRKGEDDEKAFKPDSAMTISEAAALPGVSVPLRKAEGQISKEYLYFYPPGIPLLAPGERITGELIEKVKTYQRAGFPVQGLSDPTLTTIITVAPKKESMVKCPRKQ